MSNRQDLKDLLNMVYGFNIGPNEVKLLSKVKKGLLNIFFELIPICTSENFDLV
jgi:hypothetical protein